MWLLDATMNRDFSFFNLDDEILHVLKKHATLMQCARRYIDSYRENTKETGNTFSCFNQRNFPDLKKLAIDILNQQSSIQIINRPSDGRYKSLTIPAKDLYGYNTSYSGLAFTDISGQIKVGICDEITLVYAHNANNPKHLHLITMYPSMSNSYYWNCQDPSQEICDLLQTAIEESSFDNSTKTWLRNYILEDRDLNLIQKEDLPLAIKNKIQWPFNTNTICSYLCDENIIVIGNEIDYYLMLYQHDQWNIYPSKTIPPSQISKDLLNACQGMGEIIRDQAREFSCCSPPFNMERHKLKSEWLQKAIDPKFNEFSF